MNPHHSSFPRRAALGAAALLAAAGVYAAVGAATPGSSASLKLNRDTKEVNRGTLEAASFAPVVKRVIPSVVEIDVKMRARNVAMGGENSPLDNPLFRQFFGNQMPQMQQPEESGLGSGVILTSDGYIVTNNHVVANAKDVKVMLQDGRSFPARVVGRDPQTDVAVVKIDAKDLPAITFASSSQVQVGDRVLAVGNPFGIGETVTTGIVSAKERRAGLGLAYEDFIQTDAAINPGNSGGALVDIQGRMVGMNTAILSRSGGFQGVGLAVPADLVSSIANNIVEHGKVVRSYIGVGVQDLTPSLAEQFGIPQGKGAVITDVQPATPAAKAGLKSGDVITGLNGQPIDGGTALSIQISETTPGTKLSLDALRDGKAQQFAITTERKPATRDGASAEDQQVSGDDQGVLKGLGVTDLDHDTRTQLQLPDRVNGALVSQVDPNSACAAAGIQQGDVVLEINRHPVHNAADAVRLSGEASGHRTLVKLFSHGNVIYVVVDESGSQGGQ